MKKSVKYFSAKTFYWVLLMLFPLISDAQQTPEKYVRETNYLLYLPDGYSGDTTKKWPLLIFLHGSGESGTDLEKVKMHGPPKLIEQGRKFPFIIVSPQAPQYAGWQVDVIKGLLDDLKKRHRIDNDRVYLTGLSMGGFGTWNFSEKYPDELAAIAPICGGGDVDKVWQLRHMPVWCFHGAKDDVVLPASSQKMVDALREYNSNVKFTLYPEANHNSWEVTYNNDSLYQWLLAQRKFRHKQINMQADELRKYEGTYVNESNFEIKITVYNNKLFAFPGRDTIELKPSSATNFFIDENAVMEISFYKDKNDKMLSGFTLFADVKENFARINEKKKSN